MAQPGAGERQTFETLRELLEQGGVVLTANARAARALHRRHAEWQQAAGAVAWPTPHILDLESWLVEQWHALLLAGDDERLLLNSAQEQAVWQRMVEPALADRSLIAPERLTALAQQAYALLAAHGALGRLDDAVWGSEAHSESELFRQWARSFRQECRRRRWLPHCELSGAIAEGLRKGAIAPPQRVGWLGFDRHTPAESALLAALGARGTAQQEIFWNNSHAEPVLHPAASAADQAAACAQWARQQLHNHPAARIGILAPELSALRPQLERALFRALAAEQFPIRASDAALPFEFALGMPLAETPLVRAALLLLRWLAEPLPQQQISWLLLSSTLGALETTAARAAAAECDARLRNARCASPEMSLDSLLRQPGVNTSAMAPLRQQLYAMLQSHRRNRRSAPAGVWVLRVEQLLGMAGWGALTHASSLSYQVRQAWAALLEQLTSLDFEQRSFSYQEWLATLQRLANETVFAPESADAPVQVMGAFAAAGQCFDALWFLSASEAQWPAAGRPHPLLPLWLQRELGMPHATPAVDSELAQRVTARVLASAGEAVFSYARQNAEAVAQQPSPLLQGMPLRQHVAVPVTSSRIALEPAADDTWVPHPDPGAARGGQRALKRQADCPFQAFALERLGARELPIAGRGLSAMERGNLLHQLLERVWSQDTPQHPHLTDSTTLRAALANGGLRTLVAAHAAQLFAALDADRSEAWQRAYLAQEERRLIELVMEWLIYEAKRREFRVVEVEKEIPLHIGALALHARADRIDQVADGRILLDYKSGEVNPSSWDGPRPEEPQLPLYAVFGDVEDLVGALFAQVRPGKLDFKGRIQSAQSNLMQSLTGTNPLVKFPYHPQLLEQWRESLTALAEGFVRGEAHVDPRDFPKTCRYCALPGLCRIAEAQPAERGSPEEVAEPA